MNGVIPAFQWTLGLAPKDSDLLATASRLLEPGVRLSLWLHAPKRTFPRRQEHETYKIAYSLTTMTEALTGECPFEAASGIEATQKAPLAVAGRLAADPETARYAAILERLCGKEKKDDAET